MFKKIRNEPLVVLCIVLWLAFFVIAAKPDGMTGLTSLWIGDQTVTADVTPAENDLFVAGTLEVDGAARFDGAIGLNGETTIGGLAVGVSTKSFGTSDSAWTLSTSEKNTTILVVSSGSDGIAVSIIAPQTTGKMYVVRVEGGATQVATARIIGAAGDAYGVTVALNNSAVVFYNGTYYQRLTADSTNSDTSE